MNETGSPKRRLLVAYMAHSNFTPTVFDYQMALKSMPGFEVDYVNVEARAVLDVNLDEYDAIFNCFTARFAFNRFVSANYAKKLAEATAVKVLAVQDEYDFTDRNKANIKRLGFDIVLTCVPQDSLEYVYPKAEFPDVDFLTVLTGYVPDDFSSKATHALDLAERPIHVGYRGRDIGGRYGQLAYDKFYIGKRMKEICDDRAIPNDIAMDEQSRIYGEAWFQFLGSCRTMLGTESGSNVFDFDGSIAAKFNSLKAKLGHPPSYEEFLPHVAERDGEIQMGQISPRVFECALMGTAMVLFKGSYSGAISPGEHYVALEKDFSNIDDVLRQIDDIDGLRAITDRARSHLIESGAFRFKPFLARVAKAIEAKLQKNGHLRAPGQPAIDWRDMPLDAPWKRQIATTEPIPAYVRNFQYGMKTTRMWCDEYKHFHRAFRTQANYNVQRFDAAMEVLETSANLQSSRFLQERHDLRRMISAEQELQNIEAEEFNKQFGPDHLSRKIAAGSTKEDMRKVDDDLNQMIAQVENLKQTMQTNQQMSEVVLSELEQLVQKNLAAHSVSLNTIRYGSRRSFAVFKNKLYRAVAFGNSNFNRLRRAYRSYV